MLTFTRSVIILIFVSSFIITYCQDGDKAHPSTGSTADKHSEATSSSDKDSSQSEYGRGSACSYCIYAKFCDLCEKDCPCETSKSKPNCHMCKYCRFCSLTRLCDTICRPGGIIDTVSSSLWSALPSWNKDDLQRDIETVKDYL
ncbi:sarcoplasmic reticulum histidine-rich calcium-binding protein-like isoform X1 [Corticium candelabrum]|uniref:sarcoplasmic reticulum histidine-rich calcium-binding protein-like isoform X1 n=1 Tax=Corticium candelabrum TaxID=121492 RepID=UPI002E25C6BD|nr:sarcoplasmic reticulum histidine-rich calcium-binding protein-like isoform X1 [Corticium candelabrum]